MKRAVSLWQPPRAMRFPLAALLVTPCRHASVECKNSTLHTMLRDRSRVGQLAPPQRERCLYGQPDKSKVWRILPKRVRRESRPQLYLEPRTAEALLFSLNSLTTYYLPTTNHKPQNTNHKPQTTNHTNRKPQTTNHKTQNTKHHLPSAPPPPPLPPYFPRAMVNTPAQ